MTDSEVVTEPAPAKINPFLRVLGRRDDGFHEIETLILPISPEDHVAVSPRDEGFGLRVAGPLAERVPKGDDNLAIRAARVLAEATDQNRGANILIEKHVPVAAGLGGGSADAAAVLRALNRMWGLDLDVRDLARIGTDVGSDVPALVLFRPVIARGRGELIEAVDVPQTHWVLVTFPFEVSASDAYAGWRRRLVLRKRPAIAKIVDALIAGDLRRAGSALENDLAPGVIRRHPEIRTALAQLAAGRPPDRAITYSTGPNTPRPVGVVMTGSGPTLAGLCADEPTARRVARMLGGQAVTTSSGAPPDRLG